MSLLKYTFALIIIVFPAMNCQAAAQLQKTCSRFGTMLKSHPRLACSAAIGLVGAGAYYGLKHYLQKKSQELHVKGTISFGNWDHDFLKKLEDYDVKEFRVEINLGTQFNQPIKDFLGLQQDTSIFKTFSTQLWIFGTCTGDKIKRLGKKIIPNRLYKIVLRKSATPGIPLKLTLQQTDNDTQRGIDYNNFDIPHRAAAIPHLAVLLQDGTESIDLADENTYWQLR